MPWRARYLPTWKSGLLTYTGRALLTKVTLSAVPVHISISLCLSSWLGDRGEDICRPAFLWQGTRSTTDGHCKVAWRVVCVLKDSGGLGIPDLWIVGFTLRLRWEWLKHTRGDAAWSLLPSKAEKAVTEMPDASVSVVIGDARTTSSWCRLLVAGRPSGEVCPCPVRGCVRWSRAKKNITTELVQVKLV